jgi:hypothetical protein
VTADQPQLYYDADDACGYSPPEERDVVARIEKEIEEERGY